jgi:regulator of RNase E activity RraA
MDPNVARLQRLDTATLSDALDRHAIAGQCLGIKPRDPHFRMAGRAVTLRYVAAGSQPGNVGDYIDDVAPGSVLVLDNGGREDATVWGDILTLVAHRRGIAGTVIDGPCRDIHLCLELGYPVFSRSYSMRTGKDRVQLEAMNITVTIGGATVGPGDLIRGDADGVIAIPRREEETILATAEHIAGAEQNIRDAVLSGMRLDEARKRFGYFKLQSK